MNPFTSIWKLLHRKATVVPAILEIQAAELLLEHGINGQAPIHLENLAMNMGYTPVSFSPKTHSNKSRDMAKVLSIIDPKVKKIYINDDFKLGIQRQALAHAIAFIVYHPEESIVLYKKDVLKPTHKEDCRISQLATAILTPRVAFRASLAQFRGDSYLLAAQFGTTMEAVVQRERGLQLTN